MAAFAGRVFTATILGLCHDAVVHPASIARPQGDPHARSTDPTLEFAPPAPADPCCPDRGRHLPARVAAAAAAGLWRDAAHGSGTGPPDGDGGRHERATRERRRLLQRSEER